MIDVEVPSSGAFQVLPGAEVDDYDDWLVGDVEISFSRRQRPLEEREQQKIVDLVEAVITAVLEEREQMIASAPGPCTVALDVRLEELAFHETKTTGSSVAFIRSFGRARFVTEVRDTETGRVLSRYTEERDLGGGVEKGRVEPNLDRLAKVLVLVLRERAEGEAAARGPSLTPMRAERGCSGLIGVNRRELGSW